MPRHTDWMRLRITPTSDPAVAASYISQGRLMLGDMMQGLALVGQKTGVLRRKFRDGTVIIASFDGTTPTVTIDSPPPDDESISGAIFNLWVPRGFLVYPAWSNAVFGVGLPIITDSSAGPYDPINLAPGLPRERWTPGGPCGEVLISQDKNAGYATSAIDIPVPLLFDATKGPVFHWPDVGYFDARPADGAWTSYRMELAPFVAHYGDESVANSQAMFEAINTYRAASSLPALNLQPRGYYDPAQVMVSIMQAAGTDAETSLGYPATYRTMADRLTKDGYGATLIAAAFTGFDRGSNPTAFEVRSIGGGASDALLAWQNDNTANASLLKDVGKGGFGDVGFRGGWWAANVISRTSWIQAGNAGWQSADASLPYLSWNSFASVNLAWETYPAQYDGDNYQTVPLVITRPFTDSHGDCWLRYLRNPSPKAADMEPALSRHIYMRGRSIAVAPRGGLIWGASIIAIKGRDRLVALVHHPEDQSGNPTSEGFTRYLRVWWADIPNRTSLRADPQKTICGEDPTDDWAWRGGQLLDVGSMPAPPAGPVAATSTANSLKYASCWKFSSDGTRAVCLRDYASLVDYQALYYAQKLYTDDTSYTTLGPRAVELTFVAEADATTTTVTFHDHNAGSFAAGRPVSSIPGTQDVQGVDFPANMVDTGTRAMAVDYDRFGNIVYAYQGLFVSSPNGGSVKAIGVGTPPLEYALVQHYYYVGTGSINDAYCSALRNKAVIGTTLTTRSLAIDVCGITVLDVLTGTFIVEGARPRFKVFGLYDYRPAVTKCFPFTDEPVHGIGIYRLGSMVFQDWYGAPDGVVFGMKQHCYNASDAGYSFFELIPSISRNVQGHYSQKDGDLIYGYQLSPAPLASRVLNNYPNDSVCGCALQLTAMNDDVHWMTDAELNPVGGRMQSSIPLPDSDWLIYSKVV